MGGQVSFFLDRPGPALVSTVLTTAAEAPGVIQRHAELSGRSLFLQPALDALDL
jgi:hypothetical protein